MSSCSRYIAYNQDHSYLIDYLISVTDGCDLMTIDSYDVLVVVVLRYSYAEPTRRPGSALKNFDFEL